MIRSLYSGVSGLTNHQTKMDVIGNNIANVNTYGFKAGKAMFKDVYYQAVNSPTAGSTSQAGNNPATVGYGVQIAGISKDMSMSNLQSTSRTLDLAISGEGFFVTATFPSGTTQPGAGAEGETEGGFTSGNIPLENYASCASVTYTRMGFMSIDSYGNLVGDSNKFLLGTRNSAQGLYATGTDSDNALLKQQLTDVNNDGKINANDLNFSNTLNINELIQEAYNIHTDANGYLITYQNVEEVENEDGSVSYTYSEPAYCTKTGELIYELDDAGKPTDTLLSYVEPSPDDAGGEEAEAVKGAVKGTFTYSDLGAFTIDQYGVIKTTFNNKMKSIARIEVAVFDNQEGLVEAGNTSFVETAASGEAKIKKPGDEGAGNVISNKLEMSNVNLASEFSDMIVTQRGFQANSRIITVSDSMLEELVNLKR